MKTNPFARAIVKSRVILFCLAVLGMAGAGFSLGESLTVRFGQAAALGMGCPQAPNVNLGQLMDATR